MPFWKLQRATGGNVTDGSAALDPTPTVEPIQVYTADRHLDGWVVATQDRITDVLNDRQELRVCLDAAADVWETVDREDILLVAPPARMSHPQRRVHRRKQRLVALVGPFVVTGTAHLQPGASLDPFLLRTRQHFLPMTDAVVTSRIDASLEEQLPVVIVNVNNLVELRSQLGIV